MASTVQAPAGQTNIQQTSTAGEVATSQNSQASVGLSQSSLAAAADVLIQRHGQEGAPVGIAQEFREFSQVSIDGPILLSLRPGSFIRAFEAAPGIFEEDKSIAFDILNLLVLSGSHAGRGSAHVPILSRPTLRTLHNRLALLQTRADEILSKESTCTSDSKALSICAKINNLFEEAQVTLVGSDFVHPAAVGHTEMLLLKAVVNDYKTLTAAQKKGPFYIHFLLTCLSREPGALQFLNSRLVKSDPELAAALLNPAPLIDRLLGQASKMTGSPTERLPLNINTLLLCENLANDDAGAWWSEVQSTLAGPDLATLANHFPDANVDAIRALFMLCLPDGKDALPTHTNLLKAQSYVQATSLSTLRQITSSDIVEHGRVQATRRSSGDGHQPSSGLAQPGLGATLAATTGQHSDELKRVLDQGSPIFATIIGGGATGSKLAATDPRLGPLIILALKLSDFVASQLTLKYNLSVAQRAGVAVLFPVATLQKFIRGDFNGTQTMLDNLANLYSRFSDVVASDAKPRAARSAEEVITAADYAHFLAFIDNFLTILGIDASEATKAIYDALNSALMCVHVLEPAARRRIAGRAIPDLHKTMDDLCRTRQAWLLALGTAPAPPAQTDTSALTQAKEDMDATNSFKRAKTLLDGVNSASPASPFTAKGQRAAKSPQAVTFKPPRSGPSTPASPKTPTPLRTPAAPGTANIDPVLRTLPSSGEIVGCSDNAFFSLTALQPSWDSLNPTIALSRAILRALITRSPNPTVLDQRLRGLSKAHTSAVRLYRSSNVIPWLTSAPPDFGVATAYRLM